MGADERGSPSSGARYVCARTPGREVMRAYSYVYVYVQVSECAPLGVRVSPFG